MYLENVKPSYLAKALQKKFDPFIIGTGSRTNSRENLVLYFAPWTKNLVEQVCAGFSQVFHEPFEHSARKLRGTTLNETLM